MATITLKNIPEQLHKKIKERAVQHHRSLNSEIIACLERSLVSRPVDTDTLLARARSLRSRLSVRLTNKDLTVLKNQDRP
jgi:plasmid stability protein